MLSKATENAYVAVCTFAKGSIPEQEGKGPRHFTLGMRKDIRVT
jgi:hypothetical protein